MQFSPDMVEVIMTGRKTRTTRPVRRERIPLPPEYHGVPVEYVEHPCRYKVGHDYAVCPGRGKRQVARILVTGIKRYECLLEAADNHDRPRGSGSEPDSVWREMYALAEGFSSWPEFFAKWTSLYRRDRVRRNGRVWTSDLELVKGAEHGS